MEKNQDSTYPQNNQNIFNGINITDNYTDESNNKTNQSNIKDEKNMEEFDEFYNLRNRDISGNMFFTIRGESCDYTPIPNKKFSIDNPNAPKQIIHNLITEDLLKELDSPQPPEKEKSFPESNYKENDKINDANINLYGFHSKNQIPPKSIINKYSFNNNVDNLGNIINTSNSNSSHYLNCSSNNNINNYTFLHNNFNYYLLGNNNIQNIPGFFPNNNQFNNNIYFKGEKDVYIPKENSHFENGYMKQKQNSQYTKKEKTKKHFVIREGDWTCNKCFNLNFSFRIKCNKCGISKEKSFDMKKIKEKYNHKYYY